MSFPVADNQMYVGESEKLEDDCTISIPTPLIKK